MAQNYQSRYNATEDSFDLIATLPSSIVNSINGQSGNFTIAAGANISFLQVGSTLTISSTGGGGGGSSPLTTKGDLYGFSTVNDRLPVGTDGYVLSADSTQALGLKWIAAPTSGVTSVSGTTNRITSTGGTTPILDISASYIGQSSITTLGTIATGIWNGTAIGASYIGDLSATYATVASLANTKITSVGFTIPNSASAVIGKVAGFFTCPYAGTITGWNIVTDAGTVTVTVWKIATGTAHPTVANSISTDGVALSSGTAVHSSTTSDFTSTTVTANDIFAFNISAISGVGEMTFNLEITKT